MNESEILRKINEIGINKAYILATFFNKVCIGYFENNKLYFNDEIDFNMCIQIRIFNENIELKILKIDGNIYSKTIEDKDYSYILNDEYMFISGNKIIEKNDKFTVIEQMNRKVALPIDLTDDEIKKGIRIIVRNYCNIDENNQLTIVESRLVGFSKDEVEVKINAQL